MAARFTIRRDRITIFIWFWLAVSLITLRIMLWRIEMPDFVQSFLPWHDYLISHGGLRALRHPFSDYFPAYFELTAVFALFDRHLSRVTQLKLIPLMFDLLTASLAARFVWRLQTLYPKERQSTYPCILAFFAILAGPTVILNGIIGTDDITYTLFLILTVYLLCSGRGALAALSYGFAIAFKLQSVFLAPFFLAMCLRRKVPVWSIPLVCGGWIAALLPVMAVGGSPSEFLTGFSVQTRELSALAINVANPWEIANFFHVPFTTGVAVGMVVTAIVGFWIGSLGLRERAGEVQPLIALAALSLITMPYVMPKMHERYFFAGEVLLSILACWDNEYIAPAALVLSSSLICYAGYFLNIVRHHTATPVALVGTSLALYLVSAKAMRLLRTPERVEEKSKCGPVPLSS
jgi:Gpi18-like mannosyltransferase